MFLSLSTLKMSCQSSLGCKFADEKPTDSFVVFLWYRIHFFLPCFLEDCLFLFNSCHLSTMCLAVGLTEFVLFGTFCASWTWMSFSFPRLGKFLAIISSLCCFLPFFSFWDPYNVNVGVHDVVPEIP